MTMVSREEEHLRLLKLGAYGLGGFHALCSLFPLIHIGMGVLIMLMPASAWKDSGAPPPFFGWIFILIGAVVMVSGLLFSACQIFLGRLIGRRRHWRACIILSVVTCLAVPLGTFLGGAAIWVLTRPGVKERFQTSAAGGPSSSSPLIW